MTENIEIESKLWQQFNPATACQQQDKKTKKQTSTR